MRGHEKKTKDKPGYLFARGTGSRSAATGMCDQTELTARGRNGSETLRESKSQFGGERKKQGLAPSEEVG